MALKNLDVNIELDPKINPDGTKSFVTDNLTKESCYLIPEKRFTEQDSNLIKKRFVNTYKTTTNTQIRVLKFPPAHSCDFHEDDNLGTVNYSNDLRSIRLIWTPVEPGPIVYDPPGTPNPDIIKYDLFISDKPDPDTAQLWQSARNIPIPEFSWLQTLDNPYIWITTTVQNWNSFTHEYNPMIRSELSTQPVHIDSGLNRQRPYPQNWDPFVPPIPISVVPGPILNDQSLWRTETKERQDFEKKYEVFIPNGITIQYQWDGINDPVQVPIDSLIPWIIDSTTVSTDFIDWQTVDYEPYVPGDVDFDDQNQIQNTTNEITTDIETTRIWADRIPCNSIVTDTFNSSYILNFTVPVSEYYHLEQWPDGNWWNNPLDGLHTLWVRQPEWLNDWLPSKDEDTVGPDKIEFQMKHKFAIPDDPRADRIHFNQFSAIYPVEKIFEDREVSEPPYPPWAPDKLI